MRFLNFSLRFSARKTLDSSTPKMDVQCRRIRVAVLDRWVLIPFINWVGGAFVVSPASQAFKKWKKMTHCFSHPRLLEVLKFELSPKKLPDLPQLCLLLVFPISSTLSRVISVV